MPRCKKQDCPYDRNGKCIENLLPNCPNLVSDAPVLENLVAAEVQKGSELDSRSSVPQYEVLHSGKKLNVAEATVILQSRPAQVVVLGGMVESGKTTLLARVFEMFQNNCVAMHRFAGSRTLADFEKLGWHATMESGAVLPTTVRTDRSENNTFLHMRLRENNGLRTTTDVLISDIPGEIFPEAVADESVCLGIHALRRADHLVLFLDGAVLRDTHDRHDPCGKVIDFVLRALQTGQIGLHTALHLVISKCDMLPKEADNGIVLFVKTTEKSFRDQFSERFGSLHIWRIAARPVHPEPVNDNYSSLPATIKNH